MNLVFRPRLHTSRALILIASFAVFSFSQAANAQPSRRAPRPDRRAWNALYLELLGAGIVGSINYELRPVHNFSARVGIAPLDADAVHVPVMAFLLLGHGRSLLELGAGTTIQVTGEDRRVFITADIGYRYHPDTPGGLFRIAFTPIFTVDDRPVVPFGPSGGIPSIGIAGGAAF